MVKLCKDSFIKLIELNNKNLLFFNKYLLTYFENRYIIKFGTYKVIFNKEFAKNIPTLIWQQWWIIYLNFNKLGI